MKPRKGFTLVELLVVVAIIGILAALLLPVITRAREAAKRTKCVANLKEIGNGIALYKQTYGGGTGFPTGLGKTFLANLRNVPAPATAVIQNNALFQCPNQPPIPATTPLPAASISYNGPAPAPSVTPPPPERACAACPATNHLNEGGNVLFFDFHVEWVPEGARLNDLIGQTSSGT